MTDAASLLARLAAIRRWWFVVVAMAVLGAALGWLSAPTVVDDPEPDVAEDVAAEDAVAEPGVFYQANHVLLRDATSVLTGNLDLALMLATEAEVATLAAQQLGRPDDVASIRAGVTVTVDGALGTMSVATVQPTEQEAEVVASAYAEAVTQYFDRRRDQDLRGRSDNIEDQLAVATLRAGVVERQVAAQPVGSVEQRLAVQELDGLIQQIAGLRTQQRDLEASLASDARTFTTLQAPVALRTADSPDDAEVLQEEGSSSAAGPRRRGAAGFVLGTLLGLALAFVIDLLDTRLRTVEDAEQAFGLPVLAVLPAARQWWRRRSQPAELPADDLDTAYAHQMLAVALRVSPRWQLRRATPTPEGPVGTASEVANDGVPPRVLLVTSASTQEGRSTTVMNLAAALAEAELHVLVVDCDFRSPVQDRLLGAGEGPGMRDRAGGVHSLHSLVRPTGVPGVSVLPAGPAGPAPASLLTDGHLLVDRCRDVADVVLIDTGPLLQTNEAATLVGAVDGVLLLARQGRTSTRLARACTQRLARLNAVASGVAFIGEGGPERLEFALDDAAIPTGALDEVGRA